MACVTTEFQNVPLSNAQVLQQLPGGVSGSIRYYSSNVCREVCHDLIEAYMGALSGNHVH